MWDAMKAFFFNLLKGLGFIGMTMMGCIMVGVFFDQTSGVWEPSGTHIVEEKYAHKGLYFSQQYFVKLSNGGSHSVFKHDFNALEKGDIFQPVFKSLSWKDFWFITFMTGFGSLLFFGMAYFFAFLIFHERKLFQRLEAKRKQMMAWLISFTEKSDRARERWKKGALLTLVIVLSIPYILIGKNLVVKMIPLGKENAVAKIQDRHIEVSRGFRGRISNIYTLTYTFQDKDNEIYQMKKDVSRHTYYKYKNTDYIPIVYRKRFPYESFIDIQSVREVVSALLRYSNFVLFIMASLLYYFIRKYIEVWGVPLVGKK